MLNAQIHSGTVASLAWIRRSGDDGESGAASASGKWKFEETTDDNACTSLCAWMGS
jgi:hypothetical protein